MRRRSILPVVVGTLVVCAWLHARGFAALVGGKLAAPRLDVVTEARAAVEPRPPVNADPILSRNPFDSVTGSLLGVRPAPSPGEPTPDPSAPCEGVRVISIVAADDPEFSLVALHLPGERGPVLRRRGGEVLAIEPDRVFLQRDDGTSCVARMFASPGAPSVGSPRPAGAVTRAIVRTGAGSFALDRNARDALIDGAGDLMRSVAVRPEKQGDDVIGLRIATLQPGTALDALGVHAGDVLLSLDGISLTSPDRMLQAYARVRTEERVHVVVLRDGRPLDLDYVVR